MLVSEACLAWPEAHHASCCSRKSADTEWGRDKHTLIRSDGAHITMWTLYLMFHLSVARLGSTVNRALTGAQLVAETAEDPVLLHRRVCPAFAALQQQQ